jgi:hypothetical protein
MNICHNRILTTLKILKYIYYFLILFSFFTLLLNKKRLPSSCIWILLILPAALFSQIIEEVLYSHEINSLYLLHSYTILECTLIVFFYYSLFKIVFFKKFALIGLGVYLLGTGLYVYINPKAFGERAFIDMTIQCFFVCILVVLLYIEMLQVKHKIELRYYTAFWLNAVHLIFYGGILFVMGCYYFLNASDPLLAGEFLKINYFLNLFLYSGYTIIFLCTATPRISS